jgi:hypothetical protein
LFNPAQIEAAPGVAPARIHVLAQAHTESAIDVLRVVMTDPEATPAARVTAATAMLDRGWGKATQPAAGDDSTETLRIETIRRIIVRPGHQHSGSVPPAVGAGAL